MQLPGAPPKAHLPWAGAGTPACLRSRRYPAATGGRRSRTTERTSGASTLGQVFFPFSSQRQGCMARAIEVTNSPRASIPRPLASGASFRCPREASPDTPLAVRESSAARVENATLQNCPSTSRPSSRPSARAGERGTCRARAAAWNAVGSRPSESRPGPPGGSLPAPPGESRPGPRGVATGAAGGFATGEARPNPPNQQLQTPSGVLPVFRQV